MAERRVAFEYTIRHLTRPLLSQYVGDVLRTNPAVPRSCLEIIVRCRSAARTAMAAVAEYDVRVTIVTDAQQGR